MTAMPAPWPSGARRTSTGAVAIAGVDLVELAATGTPVYVLDEHDMRGRARAYRDAFATASAEVGTEVDVYYAGKAFLSTAVARWMHAEGLRIDSATLGELTTALRAGVPAADIGLHGNNKSDEEIELALTSGVGRLVLDSLPEVARVADAAARLGVRAPVMVRVTTGVHAGGHEYISTAHEDQKFGLSMASPDGEDSPAVTAVLAVLERTELDLLGLHSHIGSQILDPAGFGVATRAVMGLRAEIARRTGVLVPELDLGGGFGVAYLPGEVPLDPERAAKEMVSALADVGRELGTPLPRLSIEPGRSVVAPAGITLYTVGTVKPVRTEDGTVRTYVAVDGGMSDNIRPALYGAAYHAEIVSRVSEAPGTRCRVVGKHCESGDIVVHDVELPADVAAGDLLAVAVTGAYGRSMASTYNLVPRPGVVAVADGVATPIVRRETVEDLLALDLG
ncbi:diaminopimelate decarboxylase [Serinibacter arcticus]|uniref:Diaminopimelate decarboxylase n=1 Tax=Serinibacter arcticus TaxID=1655435 RepID=A0A2U1ZYX1_9MICO|nr:diaminopimelate decarboxylase [Serinibacter arcticus]PWD52164.1 diaminopimelate decarboxylase [Serinibacter arcticus]